jgi:hypothetical protein
LRGIGHNALHDRCYIPTELLIESDCSTEQLMRSCREVLTGQSKQLPTNVREVTYRLASQASIHLQKAQTILTTNRLDNNRTSHLFLPAEVISRYLNQLQRIDFDVLNRSVRSRDGLLPIYLWWKTFR